MIRVQYPDPQFRTKTVNNKQYIFDAIRRIRVLLTQEEWVRQNFINYLVNAKKYPSTLVAVEKEINLHELKKRFDILIYYNCHQPWMLVECNASSLPINEDALQQVLRYNISVPVEYILITNGNSTLGWKKENGELKLLNEIPEWS